MKLYTVAYVDLTDGSDWAPGVLGIFKTLDEARMRTEEDIVSTAKKHPQLCNRVDGDDIFMLTDECDAIQHYWNIESFEVEV